MGKLRSLNKYLTRIWALEEAKRREREESKGLRKKGNLHNIILWYEDWGLKTVPTGAVIKELERKSCNSQL